MEVKGTTSLGKISGSGDLTISGNSTNNSTVSQNNLYILSDSQLTSSGTITASVENTGTFSNGSILNGTLLNNTNAVTTSDAGNLKGVVTNYGTLNLSGTAANTITGTCIVNVGENGLTIANTFTTGTLDLTTGTLKVNKDTAVTLTNFTANGGRLDLQNDKTEALNLGNVTLTDDMYLSVDTDLNACTSDYLSATGINANTHKIIIDSIMVLADAQGEALPTSIIVADATLKDFIRLSQSQISVV